MMNCAIFVCILISCFTLNFAYWIEDSDDAVDNYDDAALDTFKTAKRLITASSCMPWGLPCLSDTEFYFAKCCPGFVCACNIWKTNCKCRSRLG